MVAHISVLGRQRQVYIYELEASLVYIETSEQPGVHSEVAAAAAVLPRAATGEPYGFHKSQIYSKKTPMMQSEAKVL